MRELLVDTCRETGEDGRSHGYRYYILVGEMAVSGGLACESYGVKVVGEDGFIHMQKICPVWQMLMGLFYYSAKK